MKFIVECLLAVFLHPLAVVLAWINVLGRSDLRRRTKIAWLLIITFVWGIGPILYVLLGDGALW